MISKHLSTLKPETNAGITTKGVYVSLRELASFQHKATGFSFLPKQPVHSLLSGRHASRLRGRGLNFEEIRQYRLGDDIRSMDWRVTARLQKPHVRVYSEERDRPVYFVVDQRIAMFFGSVVNMKSVTATQVAALGLWRAFSLGDRVGGCIFNDNLIHSTQPRHTKNNVYELLNQLVKHNQALNAQQVSPLNEPQLNQALKLAAQQLKHDGLCCVISDGSGFNDETQTLLARIGAKNDVLWGQVFDPLEMKLVPHQKQSVTKHLVASDGLGQLDVPVGDKELQAQYAKVAQQRANQLKLHLKKLRIPLLWFNTVEPVENQLRGQLGYAPRTIQKRGA